jgi:hypothetical protein
MSSTFSIYSGQVIESTSKVDILSALQGLPNNTQKLITPRDVRDAFLTVFSSSSFKITRTSSNQEYIGLDSSNPNDRDIKKKIFIGKRSIGSFDIMSDSILNNIDADIVFYNTKPDSSNQDSTKISILAGTNSSLYLNAPYIQSLRTGNSISFNIKNEQQDGSINILSNTGRVSINGISFPTISETQNSASNGKILKYSGTYPFGQLEWGDATSTGAQIGLPGSQTNIYGSPVLLNGYSLEFIDNSLIPIKVGDFNQGFSFSAGSFNGQNWPLSEVVRGLLYPYIPPLLTLNVTSQNGNKFAEVGSTVALNFTYSITTYARDNSEGVSRFFLRTNGTASTGTWTVIGTEGGQLTGLPGSTFDFSQSFSVTSNGLVGEVQQYGLMVSTINDPGILSIMNPSTNTFGYSHSVIDSITFIGPYMYAFSNILFNFTPVDISSLIGSPFINKIVEPFGGVGSKVNANINNIFGPAPGFIYFMYPSSYPLITRIKDPNGFIFYDTTIPASSGTFTYSVVTPAPPYNYYGNYRVYRISSPTSLPPIYNLEFTL